MKPSKLYNSNTGRVARPRKQVKVLGQPSKELATELRRMTLFERKDMYIRASMCVIGMGVNLMGG